MKESNIKVKLDDGNLYRVNFTDWAAFNYKKTLICVHGITRNSRDFDYIAKELSSNYGYRVICLDMPGRGKSEYLNDCKLYTYENYVRVIIELIAKLNIETFDYLGTSMGGILAFYLAKLENISFENLILNDIGTFIPKESLIKIAKYISYFPKFNELSKAKDYLKIKLANFGIKQEENWDYITKHSYIKNSDAEYIFNYDLNVGTMLSSLKDDQIQDVNYEEFWQFVKFKNLLILRGDKSDVLSYNNAKEMIQGSDNSKLIEFVNTGHAPALMERDQINALVEWIKDK